MADPRFFETAGPFALGELARIGEAELAPGADPEAQITDVATLAEATADQISFLDNRKYVSAFKASLAGACVVAPRDVDRAPPGMALVVSGAPYRSFALIAQAFYPISAPEPGVHAAAVVDETAVIDGSARIDAGAVIGALARVGPRSHVGPNAVIHRSVVVGADCRIGACATLEYCTVGDRVNIHAGVRIGTRGFGIAPDPRGHVEFPQIGLVTVGDDVEIGANSSIDRGMGSNTAIGAGTKIDNLVQIGHNVSIGRNCIIAGHSGIAGSTQLEDFVICGAKVGIGGHLTIGAGARIAAMSGLMRDVPPGETVAGAPAAPHRLWLRRQAMLERMVKHQGKSKDAG